MKNLQKPIKIISRCLHSNAYMRLPNEERRKTDKQKYKKGYEIRFVAKSDPEHREIADALKECGFNPGKPFKKGTQIIVPLYGREALIKLKELLEL